MDDELVTLDMRLMHLEDLVAGMNRELARVSADRDALREEVDLLSRRLRKVEGHLREAGLDE